MVKVTGSLLSKSDEEVDTPSFSRHFICCLLNVYSNSSPGEASSDGKKIRRKYSPKNLGSVKGLSIAQVVFGLLIIGCQIAPTYWVMTVNNDNDGSSDVRLSMTHLDHNLDIIFPGVWCGLFIVITGIVGLVAVSKNSRCLIIAHLVLNAFAILFAIAIAALAAVSAAGLVSCKVDGTHIYIDDFGYDYNGGDYNSHDNSDYYDYYYGRRNRTTTTTTTTTTPSPVHILGEVFTYPGPGSKYGQAEFYCTHSLFTAWIALEVAMIGSGLLVCGLTICLLVKNFKALLLCCRVCCTVDDDAKDEDDISLITA